MQEGEIVALLESVDAVLKGHFVFTSGKHGDTYINKDALLPHVEKTMALCRVIAEHFRFDEVQAVIAPAVGGVALSHWVAYHLGQLMQREVLAVYAERFEGGLQFRRGYGKLISGKRVLAVEDILTSGKTAKELIAAARCEEADVIGLGALCNRGGVTALDVGGVPKFFALANVTLSSWDEPDCPLCRKGMVFNTRVGHAADYLRQRACH